MTLRRCPFCGAYSSQSIVTLHSCKENNFAPDVHFVRCDSCESTGPYSQSQSEAAARWNIRRNHRVERAKNFIRSFIAENKPNE